MRSSSFLIFLLLLVCASLPALTQEQQFANLGDFKLENGEVIRECRIGYRAFGQLNADKSNAILFPTWASGTTEQLAGSVGTGNLADSSKYYVILSGRPEQRRFLFSIQQSITAAHAVPKSYDS